MAVGLHARRKFPALGSRDLDLLAGDRVKGIVGCGQYLPNFDGLDDVVVVVDVKVAGDHFVLDVFDVVKHPFSCDWSFDLSGDVGIDGVFQVEAFGKARGGS